MLVMQASDLAGFRFAFFRFSESLTLRDRRRERRRRLERNAWCSFGPRDALRSGLPSRYADARRPCGS